MARIFEDAYEVLKDDGYFTVIIGPTQWNGVVYDHAIDFYSELETRYEFVRRVIVPYTQSQFTGFQMALAKKHKFLLKAFRDLLVFKKFHSPRKGGQEARSRSWKSPALERFKKSALGKAYENPKRSRLERSFRFDKCFDIPLTK